MDLWKKYASSLAGPHSPLTSSLPVQEDTLLGPEAHHPQRDSEGISYFVEAWMTGMTEEG